jgi:drug/metabolite transporter (DMT)-like permease
VERANLSTKELISALRECNLNKENHILPVLAGIFISFIFGFSFLFSKQSLMTMKPFELLAHRFSLAAVLLIILALTKIIKIRLNLALIRDLLPLASFQPLVYFLGETYGVKLTSASESGLIISLIPVVVTLMGNFFLKEHVGIQQWFLVLLSVFGVILIVLSGSGYQFGIHMLGICSLLVAVIAAAAYNILSRRSSRNYTPIEITVVMMVVGAIFFNCLWLLTIKPNEAYFAAFFDTNALIALLYLGIVSSVGAFFLMNYMLKKMPAFQVATFVNLTTVISVIAGVIFRHESFGIYHIVGGSLILIGVWGVNSTVYKIANK